MTKALVVVSSRTGNTRIVGHAVADALGAEYVGAEAYLENPAAYADADPVVLGFWNDRGMAPEDMQAVTPEREARRKAAETHPDRMDLLKAEEHFKAAFPECCAENE